MGASRHSLRALTSRWAARRLMRRYGSALDEPERAALERLLRRDFDACETLQVALAGRAHEEAVRALRAFARANIRGDGAGAAFTAALLAAARARRRADSIRTAA